MVSRGNYFSSDQQTPSKFLVIGDSHCGKTTFLDYYCNSKSKKQVKETIGCELHIKNFGNNRDMKKYIEFWDLSGDVLHQPFLKVYTQALHKANNDFKGIIFFFDATNEKSLYHLSGHLANLKKNKEDERNNYEDDDLESLIHSRDRSQNFKIPLFIVGNKADLLDEKARIKSEKKVRDYLQYFFGEGSNIKHILLSRKASAIEVNEFENFIEACLTNKGDLYFYNSEKDLNIQVGYQSRAKKNLNKFEKEVKKFSEVFLHHAKTVVDSIKSFIMKRY